MVLSVRSSPGPIQDEKPLESSFMVADAQADLSAALRPPPHGASVRS
jgi:hypothetical protein